METDPSWLGEESAEEVESDLGDNESFKKKKKTNSVSILSGDWKKITYLPKSDQCKICFSLQVE